METTASEISNYKGNAAAAMGSSEGVVGNILWGNTDATRVNQRLDIIAAGNLQQNKDIYDQKVKDRNELFNQISGGKLEINQMLPDDREKVRSQYLAPIRQMLLDNPDLKSDPDQYVAFQKLNTDFEEAKNYGQHRFVMLTALDKDIAAETDPEKRKRMQAHRDATASQDLFKEVKPYQQVLDFSDEAFSTSPPSISTSEAIVGDTIMTTTKTHTPLEGFVKGSLNNYTDSPNKSLKNQIDTYADSFRKLSQNDQAQKILEWNNKINQANSDEGLKPGDPYYVAPIVSHFVQDETGIHLVVPETAQRIGLAQSILRGYQNTTSQTPKVSKLPSDIEKNKADAAKTLAETKIKMPAEVDLLYAQAAKARADAAKTRQEVKAGKGLTPAQANGDYFIDKVATMFDPEPTKDLPKATSFFVDKEGVQKQAQYREFKGLGNGQVMMYTTEDNHVISSLSEDQLRTLAMPYTDKTGKVGLRAPDRVLKNTDNPRDPYFIAVYDPKDEDAGAGTASGGKITAGAVKTDKPAAKPTIRYLRPMDVLERTIKSVVGENTAGKESEEYKNTMSRFVERTEGKQNFNANLFDLYGKDDWRNPKGVNAPPSPGMPAEKDNTVPDAPAKVPKSTPQFKSKVHNAFN